MTLARQACGPLALVAGAALLAAGCQSTQSKSEEIAAKLGPVEKEKGLRITEESKDVEVLETTILSDQNGTAVVVEVENSSNEALVDVPLSVELLDSKGKSVYTNSTPGLQDTLTSIPLLPPGEPFVWVNDQAFPTGDPKEVEVVVGAADALDGELPDVAAEGDPELQNDPTSGIFASGGIENATDEQQALVTIFGVARSGDEVVAAGRGAVEKLNPGRTKNFRIYFIGDPKGAEVEVNSSLTLQSPDEGNGGPNG